MYFLDVSLLPYSSIHHGYLSISVNTNPHYCMTANILSDMCIILYQSLTHIWIICLIKVDVCVHSYTWSLYNNSIIFLGLISKSGIAKSQGFWYLLPENLRKADPNLYSQYPYINWPFFYYLPAIGTINACIFMTYGDVIGKK